MWRFLAGWPGLGLALVLIALLWLVDQRLKQAPHPGFAPPDAAWTLHAPEVTRTWSTYLASTPGEALAEGLRPYTGEAQLQARLMLGIRPTPERWRLWLGDQMLAAGRDDAWTACVRPGLAMRFLHMFNRLRHNPERGLHSYGELFYAWRDGYLIASPSQSLLEETVDAPQYAGHRTAHSRAVALAWQGPPGGEIELWASPELPVQGRAQFALTRSTWPLVDLPAFGQEPIAELYVARWQDVRTLAEYPLEWLKGVLVNAGLDADVLADVLLEAWGFHALPEDWDGGVNMVALALTGVDTSGTIPVPEVAMALRATALDAPLDAHPLRAVAEEGYVVPYAWQGIPGSLTPVWGPLWTLALSATGPYWLAASREPVMERMLATNARARSRGGDAYFRFDWAAAHPAAVAMLRTAAEHELLPELNPRELDRELLPLLHALGELGRMHVDGVADGEWLIINGRLTAPLPQRGTLPQPGPEKPAP